MHVELLQAERPPEKPPEKQQRANKEGLDEPAMDTNQEKDDKQGQDGMGLLSRTSIYRPVFFLL